MHTQLAALANQMAGTCWGWSGAWRVRCSFRFPPSSGHRTYTEKKQEKGGKNNEQIQTEALLFATYTLYNMFILFTFSLFEKGGTSSVDFNSVLAISDAFVSNIQYVP